MKIYPVIKDSLDSIYNGLLATHPNRDEAIWAAFTHLEDKYYNPVGTTVDYSAPATQFAYLFKFAGSRACAVYSRHSYRRISDLYTKDALTVTNLGGGPGSDLLGIFRFYIEQNLQIKLHINLVDVDATWKEIAKIVKSAACNRLNGCPLPTVAFKELDCSAATIMESLQEYDQTDLFTLSYLLSEMDADSGTRLLDAIVGIAKPGAVVLVIDNDTESIKRVLQSISGDARVSTSGIKTDCIKLQQESVDNMNPYFEQFGDYEKNGFPHITLNAAYLIATKQ